MIRLFEEYITQGFREITEDEYSSKLYKSEPEKFDQYEIDNIINMHPGTGVDYLKKGIIGDNVGIRLDFFGSNKKTIGRILIFKNLDEWFFVNNSFLPINHSYYICDQFDGLIECLKSLSKTNPKIFDEHGNIFEGFETKEDIKELIEDIFAEEVIDKYKIGKIPSVPESNLSASEFMSQNRGVYYQISESFGDSISFVIYHNPSGFQELHMGNKILDGHGVYSYFFHRIVPDCITSLKRLMRFNLDYEITFDAKVSQNRYQDLFVFILKLDKIRK